MMLSHYCRLNTAAVHLKTGVVSKFWNIIKLLPGVNSPITIMESGMMRSIPIHIVHATEKKEKKTIMLQYKRCPSIGNRRPQQTVALFIIHVKPFIYFSSET